MKENQTAIRLNDLNTYFVKSPKKDGEVVLEYIYGWLQVICKELKSCSYNYELTEIEDVGDCFSYLFRNIFKCILKLYDNLSPSNSKVQGATHHQLSVWVVEILEILTFDCSVEFRDNIYSILFPAIMKIILSENVPFGHRKRYLKEVEIQFTLLSAKTQKEIAKGNDDIMKLMAETIINCGDYETQETIMYILLRATRKMSQPRDFIKELFKNVELELQDAIEDINFELDVQSTRKFLMTVNNLQIDEKKKIYSVPCITAFLGHQELFKPRSAEKFWVDFSVKSGSIQIFATSEDDNDEVLWKKHYISFGSIRYIVTLRSENVSNVTIKLQNQMIIQEKMIQQVSIIFSDDEQFKILENLFFKQIFKRTKPYYEINGKLGSSERHFQVNFENTIFDLSSSDSNLDTSAENSGANLLSRRRNGFKRTLLPSAINLITIHNYFNVCYFNVAENLSTSNDVYESTKLSLIFIRVQKQNVSEEVSINSSENVNNSLKKKTINDNNNNCECGFSNDKEENVALIGKPQDKVQNQNEEENKTNSNKKVKFSLTLDNEFSKTVSKIQQIEKTSPIDEKITEKVTSKKTNSKARRSLIITEAFTEKKNSGKYDTIHKFKPYKKKIAYLNEKKKKLFDKSSETMDFANDGYYNNIKEKKDFLFLNNLCYLDDYENGGLYGFNSDYEHRMSIDEIKQCRCKRNSYSNWRLHTLRRIPNPKSYTEVSSGEECSSNDNYCSDTKKILPSSRKDRDKSMAAKRVRSKSLSSIQTTEKCTTEVRRKSVDSELTGNYNNNYNKDVNNEKRSSSPCPIKYKLILTSPKETEKTSEKLPSSLKQENRSKSLPSQNSSKDNDKKLTSSKVMNSERSSSSTTKKFKSLETPNKFKTLITSSKERDTKSKAPSSQELITPKLSNDKDSERGFRSKSLDTSEPPQAPKKLTPSNGYSSQVHEIKPANLSSSKDGNKEKKSCSTPHSKKSSSKVSESDIKTKTTPSSRALITPASSKDKDSERRNSSKNMSTPAPSQACTKLLSHSDPSNGLKKKSKSLEPSGGSVPKKIKSSSSHSSSTDNLKLPKPSTSSLEPKNKRTSMSPIKGQSASKDFSKFPPRTRSRSALMSDLTTLIEKHLGMGNQLFPSELEIVDNREHLKRVMTAAKSCSSKRAISLFDDNVESGTDKVVHLLENFYKEVNEVCKNMKIFTAEVKDALNEPVKECELNDFIKYLEKNQGKMIKMDDIIKSGMKDSVIQQINAALDEMLD